MFDEHKFMNGKPHYVIVLDGRKVKVQYSGSVTLQNSFELLNDLFVLDF